MILLSDTPPSSPPSCDVQGSQVLLFHSANNFIVYTFNLRLKYERGPLPWQGQRPDGERQTAPSLPPCIYPQLSLFLSPRPSLSISLFLSPSMSPSISPSISPSTYLSLSLCRSCQSLNWFAEFLLSDWVELSQRPVTYFVKFNLENDRGELRAQTGREI